MPARTRTKPSNKFDVHYNTFPSGGIYTSKSPMNDTSARSQLKRGQSNTSIATLSSVYSSEPSSASSIINLGRSSVSRSSTATSESTIAFQTDSASPAQLPSPTRIAPQVEFSPYLTPIQMQELASTMINVIGYGISLGAMFNAVQQCGGHRYVSYTKNWSAIAYVLRLPPWCCLITPGGSSNVLTGDILSRVYITGVMLHEEKIYATNERNSRQGQRFLGPFVHPSYPVHNVREITMRNAAVEERFFKDAIIQPFPDMTLPMEIPRDHVEAQHQMRIQLQAQAQAPIQTRMHQEVRYPVPPVSPDSLPVYSSPAVSVHSCQASESDLLERMVCPAEQSKQKVVAKRRRSADTEEEPAAKRQTLEKKRVVRPSKRTVKARSSSIPRTPEGTIAATTSPAEVPPPAMAVKQTQDRQIIIGQSQDHVHAAPQLSFAVEIPSLDLSFALEMPAMEQAVIVEVPQTASTGYTFDLEAFSSLIEMDNTLDRSLELSEATQSEIGFENLSGSVCSFSSESQTTVEEVDLLFQYFNELVEASGSQEWSGQSSDSGSTIESMSEVELSQFLEQY